MSNRLIDIRLDEASLPPAASEAEHERQIAIFDLLEQNSFALAGHAGGPYRLRLAIEENRLVFDVKDEAEAPLRSFMLSLTPLSKVVRDYFMICDSYYEAVRNSAPHQIEALDMGRRGVHDEGSRILIDRLADKVAIDHETARRLFTLICALHARS